MREGGSVGREVLGVRERAWDWGGGLGLERYPQNGEGVTRGRGALGGGGNANWEGAWNFGTFGFGGKVGECGDDPTVGKGQGWGWVSELGRGH